MIVQSKEEGRGGKVGFKLKIAVSPHRLTAIFKEYFVPFILAQSQE